MAHNANPQPPPLHAHEIFVRVVRIARLDGMSVLWVAGLFALLSGAAHDARGAIIGLLIAGAGALELHGAALLRHGNVRGVDFLVRSQVCLLVVVLGYCALRLTYVELEPLRVAFHTMLQSPLMREMWAANQQAGVTEAAFLRQTYTLTYATFACVTLIYQGGMAIYYLRRREAVTAAIDGGA